MEERKLVSRMRSWKSQMGCSFLSSFWFGTARFTAFGFIGQKSLKSRLKMLRSARRFLLCLGPGLIKMV